MPSNWLKPPPLVKKAPNPWHGLPRFPEQKGIQCFTWLFWFMLSQALFFGVLAFRRLLLSPNFWPDYAWAWWLLSVIVGTGVGIYAGLIITLNIAKTLKDQAKLDHPSPKE